MEFVDYFPVFAVIVYATDSYTCVSFCGAYVWDEIPIYFLPAEREDFCVSPSSSSFRVIGLSNL